MFFEWGHSAFLSTDILLSQIRIRDPNQGGRDITDEIMFGARTTSTPTPPQVDCTIWAEPWTLKAHSLHALPGHARLREMADI